MKLQMIISKDRGKSKITQDDLDNIEGCAYNAKNPLNSGVRIIAYSSQQVDDNLFINLKKVNTSSKKINQCKLDNGNNAYIEIDSPNFRDINAFYQQMFSLRKYGMNFAILDSRISEQNYHLKDYTFTEDLGGLAVALSKVNSTN